MTSFSGTKANDVILRLEVNGVSGVRYRGQWCHSQGKERQVTLFIQITEASDINFQLWRPVRVMLKLYRSVTE